MEFSYSEWLLIALIFVWTGFVRSGLGFGGAALGLPFMLMVYDDLLYWLPMIGIHLLFFSALTLSSALKKVDWMYLRSSFRWIIPATLVGVFGLVSLPSQWLVVFVYSITLFYAVMWFLNRAIHSGNDWVDRVLLVLGGYVAGTSLTGAPLMVAVFARHVAAHYLRNTLFVLWFILVTIKMSAFVVIGVKIEWVTALALIPVAAIGHVAGLKAHEYILQNNARFKQVIGGMLILVSSIGLYMSF
ncbi:MULTISPECIES: TSUP family transporter [Thiomicrorhabdus]|uniref:Probable membrane transporter protein n=1 Tax=Thiomicrorhabdus heinhorstiae TaxID=2748010 RepID=A0ABS0BWE1_9GAMM|nr:MULTISPECIES: TSUP family transporter [Thiomicrorhabdus]MBF6058132.1 TSUP family transporter [Thiomicrorhabdus heinhorstiae]